jgi:hypothetical protein
VGASVRRNDENYQGDKFHEGFHGDSPTSRRVGIRVGGLLIKFTPFYNARRWLTCGRRPDKNYLMLLQHLSGAVGGN